MASAYFLKSQVQSQWLQWKNIYSKVPLSTAIQTDIKAIRNAAAAGQESVEIGGATILLNYPAPGRAAGVFAGQDDLYFLTKDALAASDDDLLKFIIEENVHLARTRAGVVEELLDEGIGAGFRQNPDVKIEEDLVADLTDDIFKTGRAQGWW